MAITFAVITGAKDTEGSIKNWLNDSTVPATNILIEAEAWIYERLRVREMLARSTSFQFDIATDSEALPSDFLDPVQYLPHNYGAPLPYYHEEAFRAPRDEAGALFEGTPSRWTVIGTTAYVDVTCDANFAGVLMYYARPAALSSGNTTNFLTVRYPTLLRTVCTGLGFGFKKDEARKTSELQIAELALREAMKTNEMSRRGQIVPN